MIKKIDMAYLLRNGINILYRQQVESPFCRVYVEFTHDHSDVEGKAKTYVNVLDVEGEAFYEEVLDEVNKLRYDMNPKRRIADAQPKVLL